MSKLVRGSGSRPKATDKVTKGGRRELKAKS